MKKTRSCMKNILNQSRSLFVTTIAILTLSVSGVAHSTGTVVKIDKYRLAVTLSPLSATVAWRSGNGYQCRSTNSNELNVILDAINSMNKSDAIKYVESLNLTRKLTHAENLICEQLYQMLVLTVAPAKGTTRPTKDLKAIKYTGNRITTGAPCEGAMIKKYRNNQNWYKIQGINETALCGEY